jgi:hypothetical protein
VVRPPAPARVTWLLGATVLALALAVPAPAAEPLRPPLNFDMRLAAGACLPGSGGAVALDPRLALGLVAFNSPYLFGGKALRSQLTCNACHGGAGLSGAAVRITFRAPLPDLRRAAAGGADIAGFVRHAVVAEFDGPPLDAAMAGSLARVAAALAPDGAQVVCAIGPLGLIGIALHLIAGGADPDQADFLADSARFVLGEVAANASAETMLSAQTILDTNRQLHSVADEMLTDRGVARSMAAQLAERWDAMLRERDVTVPAPGGITGGTP